MPARIVTRVRVSAVSISPRILQPRFRHSCRLPPTSTGAGSFSRRLPTPRKGAESSSHRLPTASRKHRERLSSPSHGFEKAPRATLIAFSASRRDRERLLSLAQAEGRRPTSGSAAAACRLASVELLLELPEVVTHWRRLEVFLDTLDVRRVAALFVGSYRFVVALRLLVNEAE